MLPLLAFVLAGSPVALGQGRGSVLQPISNVVATSNAPSEEGEGPENVVNGSGLNASGQHSTMSTTMWLAEPEDEPVHIQFEFDQVYALDEMRVWNYNTQFEGILGFGVKDATLEYSTDGTNWTNLGDVEFAQGTGASDYEANTVVPLGGVLAKYVRLTINSGWGMMSQFGLSEVQFLTGSEPTPPSGSHVIQNVVATSNAPSEEGEGPENVVNGSGLNANSEHSTKSTDMWLAEAEDGPVYIQFAFDKAYELEEMRVWNYNTQFELLLGFGFKNVTIEYSANGVNWTSLGDVQFAQGTATSDYEANTIVPLGGISARYVRLTVLSGWGMMLRFGLSEVQFLTASEPGSSSGINSIPNVIATTNGTLQADAGPENTVNGSGLKGSYEHSMQADDMWLALMDVEPLCIQFEFDAVYRLQEMWVWNHNTVFEAILGFGVKDATIEYSVDGTDWTVWGETRFHQAPGTPDYIADNIVEFDGASAKYVRLTVNSCYGMLRQAGLSEVRFFTTDALPSDSCVLVLDDFESYTDDMVADEVIFDTWIDGWVTGNNSTVGYFSAPFAEQEIVHGGFQSMPLFYDNTHYPFYSEASRSLEAELQDWLADGAESLTLYFHGSPDKDHNVETDTLYVAVAEDRGRSAVVRHPDPTALLANDWRKWTIDFDEFDGVDLSHVVRLSVGIGDPDNPQAGGSSLVYIDDICLSTSSSTPEE